MKLFRILGLWALLSSSSMLSAQKMHYTLSIPQPSNHYAEISLSFSAEAAGDYIFSMPVWTPGSYLVREFSKSVEQISAQANEKALKVEKLEKNRWKVHAPKGMLTIYYKVYCFEFSARTTFIDADQALLNGASLFMFVEGLENQSGKVDITLPKGWKSYISSMQDHSFAGGVSYTFDNYDILVDSPIQLGHFDTFEFDVLGIPHYVAMVGPHNADINLLKGDMQRMCKTMAGIVGEFPKDIKPYKYVFIVQNVQAGGGGIEHLNSTVLVMPRFNYSNTGRYRGFLSLVAHEYFHLWNVKRIRPIALGPFDYHKENYTKSLWIAEGITSYYDELALLRAGIVDRNHFLRVLGSYINGQENRPGKDYASLHDVSLDAWIKEYRPNENSKNTGYSYYSKGFVIAALLDAKICQTTGGKKSLDDVFKKLWTDFYGAKKLGPIGTGFTEEEFIMVCNEVAGERLNEFFTIWLETSQTPDYKAIFEGFKDIGVSQEVRYPISFNLQTRMENGKTIVSFIHRDGTAETLGINVNDELISINGYRINDNLEELSAQLGYPKDLDIWVSRNGLMYNLKGTHVSVPEFQWSVFLRGKAMTDSEEFWNQKHPLQHWLRNSL